MKVTVCELSENREEFDKDWIELTQYLDDVQTDLLLLPEMPFFRWIAADPAATDQVKEESVRQHQKKIKEIETMNARWVVYSTPEITPGGFLNTAYLFDKKNGYRKLHTKTYFPEEPHFWEETWFDREEIPAFDVADLGDFKIGVLLCTELWFTNHARDYGKQGADIILCPRATGFTGIEKWIICGRTSAIISGAYCVSSNRSGIGDDKFRWGGAGWIAEPVTGALIAVTSGSKKFVTHNIDLVKSRSAKYEYPLYVSAYDM
ncbi:MAG: carbon-nitrogen hydrolase family protein [Chitinophagaceae bacterium]